MTITLFGVVVIVASVVLAFCSASAMLAFVMLTMLFGGAAAIDLPDFGGSSIPPAHLAAVLFALRVVLSQLGRLDRIGLALKQNGYLVAFASLALIGALVLPNVFQGAIQLVPLRPGPSGYDPVPLQFSNQNVTTALYLLGTTTLAVTAAVAVAMEQRHRLLIAAAIAVAWAHVGFGLLDIAAHRMGLPGLLDPLRNANYAQVEQSIGEVKRLAGTFPEPSSFAAFGFVWLVLLTELWMRNVSPRATGAAALAVGAIVLLSTASTGYVSIGAYAAIIVLRVASMRMRLGSRQLVWLSAIGFGAVLATLLTQLLHGELLTRTIDLVEAMVFDKLDSDSGVERSKWAQQGIDALVTSYGMGVGIGSFRSSSLATAILGSTGALGGALFIAHLWRTMRPERRAGNGTGVERNDLSRAMAWAAVVGLIPALLISPSADPGLLFGLCSGCVLGLRAAANRPSHTRERRLRGSMRNRAAEGMSMSASRAR